MLWPHLSWAFPPWLSVSPLLSDSLSLPPSISFSFLLSSSPFCFCLHLLPAPALPPYYSVPFSLFLSVSFLLLSVPFPSLPSVLSFPFFLSYCLSFPLSLTSSLSVPGPHSPPRTSPPLTHCFSSTSSFLLPTPGPPGNRRETRHHPSEVSPLLAPSSQPSPPQQLAAGSAPPAQHGMWNHQGHTPHECLMPGPRLAAGPLPWGTGVPLCPPSPGPYVPTYLPICLPGAYPTCLATAPITCVGLEPSCNTA